MLCPCCKDELFGLRRTHRLSGSMRLWTSHHGLTALIFKSVPRLQNIEITLIRTTARQLPPPVLEHLILSAATGFLTLVPANLGIILIRAGTEKPRRCKNWHAASRNSYSYACTWNLRHSCVAVTDLEGAKSPDFSQITFLERLQNEGKKSVENHTTC